MVRCSGFVLLFFCAWMFTLSAEETKTFSIYRDGFVVARVPVAAIDSMNVNDTGYMLTLDDYLEAPKTITDWLVCQDVYANRHDEFGFMSIVHAGDLMCEDMVITPTQNFKWDYLLENSAFDFERSTIIWIYLSRVVAEANRVIDTTPASTTNVSVLQVLGQAYGLRAFAHFYLIQLYQLTAYNNVPSNLNLPTFALRYAKKEARYGQCNGRMPASMVLDQVESDLVKAKLLLVNKRTSKNELDASVVNGLLARFYLLTGDWGKAIAVATEALKGYTIQSADELGAGFMDIDNKEWMWGYDYLKPFSSPQNSFFSRVSNFSPGYAGMEITPCLIDKRLYDSIPQTDARKKLFQDATASINARSRSWEYGKAWGLPYANLKFGWDGKYTMDYCYMRASEMVLIQAEALARLGRNGEAATALKVLMAKRDSTWNATSVSVEEVLHQRRIELWGEGFGYFDLKRLNRGIDRMYEGSNHPAQALLSVPAGDARWRFQLPELAYKEIPEMMDSARMPGFTSYSLEPLSNSSAVLSFTLDNFDPKIHHVKGLTYTIDSDFQLYKRTIYVGEPVDGVFKDTITGLYANSQYYAHFFYKSEYGFIYTPLVKVRALK